MRVRKAYEDYCGGGALYAHLDSKDMEKVSYFPYLPRLRKMSLQLGDGHI